MLSVVRWNGGEVFEQRKCLRESARGDEFGRGDELVKAPSKLEIFQIFLHLPPSHLILTSRTTPDVRLCRHVSSPSARFSLVAVAISKRQSHLAFFDNGRLCTASRTAAAMALLPAKQTSQMRPIGPKPQ